MRITLSCMGHLVQFFPSRDQPMEVEVQPGESLETLLDRLGISKDLFMFAIIGDRKVDLSYAPGEGDRIILVSPVMGG